MIKTLCVFGTRPEAIKMAPVALVLATDSRFINRICVTGQHRQMLDSVLRLFNIVPDFDLEVMRPNHSLLSLSSAILDGMDKVLTEARPDIVLVHGDTTTSFIASLASFYHGIPIAHVEAGLRTGNLKSPWPEEANRKLTGAIADLHFSPTLQAAENLVREGVPEAHITVTGNTVVDALLETVSKLRGSTNLIGNLDSKFSYLDRSKRLILVTGHRRESFGQGFEQICEALKEIVRRSEDVQILYPVHLNPNVREPVERILSDEPNVFLIEPLEYSSFVYLMDRSYFLLTDSGGVQEEAPSLGKPVLVMRENTERPEAIEAGTVRLVGVTTEGIVSGASALLCDPALYKKMSHAHNPYGDGKASHRIADALARKFSQS